MTLPRPARLCFLSSSLLALALLAGSFLGQGATNAQEPDRSASKIEERDGVKIFRDLPYVTGGHVRQRLDLHLPSKSTGPRPLVAFIHGGAWQGGSKSEGNGKQFIAAGYAFASIEYRMSQDAIYPAQIEDCKAAIRWLRAHSAEYEIDPARIGAWGASAGGHLVALLGTTGNIRDFDIGENLDQSSAVQCVVDWFGPSDFLRWGERRVAPKEDTSAISRLLGGLVVEKQELARKASPVYFVSKESAPFLILHGDADPLVPLQQSTELDEALRGAGVASKLITLPGAKHGGEPFTALPQIVEMAAFLNRYLKPEGK